MAQDWTYGDQPLQHSTGDQVSSFSKLAVGIGAIAGFGHIPFNNGKKGFDYLIATARGMEEYSPGHILRTFQVSHMLSPFETPSSEYRYFSPRAIEDLRKSNALWTEHTERLIGRSLGSQEILQQGFRFEGGQLRFGKTGGETLLNFASVVRSPTGADPKFQEAYVRSLEGGPVKTGNAFRTPISYLDSEGKRQAEAFMFTGGNTRAQAIKRNLFGYGTSLVERTNQLARAPFELPILSDILKKVPIVNRLKFDVVPSSGLKTFGKLTAKLGIGLAATALAYREIDYRTRESTLLDGTIFEEGITAAVGTAWTTSQKLLSRVAEWTGGHSYREWQEDTAPGSTELSKLIGFPAVGVLGGLFYGYGSRVKKQIGYQVNGLSLAQASSAVSAESEFFKKSVYGDVVSPRTLETLDKPTISMIEEQIESKKFSLSHKIARKIGEFQQGEGLFNKASRIVGKVSPRRLPWMIGAAAGLALISPFIPGALIPDTRPEDLDDLYSGKTDVAIRKGRWWEMGRSPFEGTRVDRYEKHWYPEMLARAKEKSIWGEKVPGPMEQWWKENFTYELEQKHYYDRPYPISGTAFEDIPFIGPLLGSTIGQLVKPSRHMHTEEWQGGGGQSDSEDLVKRMPEKFGYHEFPQSMGGELEPGAPVNPYGFKGTAGQQIYNMCFSRETKIKLSSSLYKEIQDIQKGDSVFLPNGPQKVLKKFTRKILSSDEILDIHIQGNFKPLTVTSNHKVLVLPTNYCSSRGANCNPCNSKESKHYKKCIKKYCDNTEPEWKQVVEIKQGDFLIEGVKKLIVSDKTLDLLSLLPQEHITLINDTIFWTKQSLVTRTRRYKDKIKTSTFLKKGKPKVRLSLPRFMEKDYNLGWLIGIFLSEGHIRKSGVEFATHTDERETHVDFTNQILKEKFNPLLKEHQRVLKLKGGQSTNGMSTFYSSPLLVKFFNLFFNIEINEKFIPDVFLEGPREYLLGIANGMIDGDGHQRKKEISINLSTEFLLKQIQNIFYNLNIITGAGSYSGFTKKGNFYTGVSLCISQVGIEKLTKENHLGFKLSKRNETSKTTSSARNFIVEKSDYLLIYKRITKIINSSYEGLLYDLEIENEHIYMAQDCIVHNSEMIGLPGFTATSIKEAVTGRQDFFDEEMQLESARRMYGSEREYWDQDIGGGLGTTELLRRLYPHRRRQIELYNPLRNQMPTWLPGPGERSADFLHGDPYSKVKKGESRLPGVGYAALNPDVKGVNPEDYSPFHRFKILADIAPYTESYGIALNQARAARDSGRMSTDQAAQMQIIVSQVAEKKKRKDFSPYMYGDRDTTPMEAILARENEKIKSPDTDKSWFQKVIGSYWETLTHNAETPLEFLTPLSPAAKLVHQRTAVEDYKKFEIYGTQDASWNHPVKDFITPTLNTIGGKFSDFIPEDVEDKRDLENYFDILKYMKNTKLKNEALEEGHTKDASEFENKRRETLFGVNPFTFNFAHIFRSLPRRDRDYFNEFIAADMTERKEIMQMIPENEKALLMARWRLKDASDANTAISKGLVTEEEEKGINSMLEGLFKDKETEGYPKSKELWTEYIATRQSGESYPDWYRRSKLLQERLQGRGLPGPDWIGFSPAIELEDIKLKIVQNEGKNMFDYDMWPDQARNIARRPAIAEAAEQLQESSGQVSEAELKSQINAILAQNNVRGASVFIRPSVKNSMTLNLEQDRSDEIVLLARKGLI